MKKAIGYSTTLYAADTDGSLWRYDGDGEAHQIEELPLDFAPVTARQQFEVTPENRARAEEIGRLYQQGYSFREIGVIVGLSYERCSQILGWFPDIEAKARQRNGAVRAETVREARRVKKAVRAKSRLKTKPSGNRRYTDEALAGWVNLFLQEHEPPYSSHDFKDFLEANGGPAQRTFTIRFGHWSKLAERFGFEPVGFPTGAPRSRRECSAALLGVAARLGRYPTFADYEALREPPRRERRGDPSGAVVRQSLGGHEGTWSGCLRYLTPRVEQ